VNWFLHWRKKHFGSSPPIPPRAFTLLSSKTDLKQLERMLKYRIRDSNLFVQALLHRSYLQHIEEPDIKSNERLEFLGDAILSMLVADFLYAAFPDAEEGKLTVLRSRLVNRKALIYYAKKIHLRDFLIVSISAAQSAEKGTETILADAYEAILGAMYLDGGMVPVRNFIYRELRDAIAGGYLHEADDNYKSALLELAQANGKAIPRYVKLKEEGPDHDRTFTVGVYLGSTEVGIGAGKNKKQAEQAAAEEALKRFSEEKISLPDLIQNGKNQEK
jgi:ribonuclease III